MLACLLVKREEGGKRAQAPGFEFVVGTALSSTDCESSPLLSRTSQTAFSLKRYCNYQQNVLSWVECVRHGSTRTTRTFRSRRQSSRSLLFLLESCRYDASFHTFHRNIGHERCLHDGMVLKKAKVDVDGRSVRACPNLVYSIIRGDGSGHLYGWGTGTELHKMHTAFLQALATC